MTRWSIIELAKPLGCRRFIVRAAPYDEAEVDLQGDTTTYCRDCPAPLAGERTSCRHCLAVRRALKSGRIAASVPKDTTEGTNER